MMRGEFGREQGINTIKEDTYLRKRDVMQINALNRLNPALQQGLMWGFILGIVQIAFSFISGFLGIIGTLIVLALYFVVAWMEGQLASQRRWSTATGVRAGRLNS